MERHPLKVGVPKEIVPGERRVAATPQTVLRLKKLGFEVLIEASAGEGADFSDAAYAEAGAEIVADAPSLWSRADLVLKVRPPAPHPIAAVHEANLCRAGGRLVSFFWPAQNKPLLDMLAARGATVLAMDCVPRVTRAQKMDALSAMANIGGYRAVVEAAHRFPRFFAGQITAAGRIDPAKVLVIGAGVAGLAAIGAARGLGASVRAFDTRPAVKEQVQSMGAEFLELNVKEEDGAGDGGYAKEMSGAFIDAEKALFASQAMDVDIIVTTALIPGKKAPMLITSGMVESMKEGSVIVDLAAEQGGNCALTKPGEAIVHTGVTIIGYTDLTSRMATQSSQLYGTTLVHLLEELGGAANLHIDLEDEVIRSALVLHEGKVTWPPPKPPPAPDAGAVAHTARENGKNHEQKTNHVPPARATTGALWLVPAALALVIIGLYAPSNFLGHFTVFILACFVGWQVVWNVTPALHTPLMSVTNAISGIIIIGGMLHLSAQPGAATTLLGVVAVLIATINAAGGFLVTRRMLAMFRR